jgi:AraC-like DNA-binding protein
MKQSRNSTNERMEPDFFSSQVTKAQRYFRNLNPDDHAPLTVVAGGRERCDSEYAISRQHFTFYGLEFVVGGRGRVILDGQSYALGPGSLFAYGPKTNHAIYSDPIDYLEKYFVDIAGNRVHQLLTSRKLLGSVSHTSDPMAILNTFEELTHYGLRHSRYSDRICSQLVELLIMKIQDTALTMREANSPAFETYQRCRHEMNVHYRQLRSLADVANHCKIDAAYLCRIFKRYDRQSPYQYLLRLRMNEAAVLLQESDALVKNVATALGFDDPYHFSRAFKKVFGLSPAHFGKTQ